MTQWVGTSSVYCVFTVDAGGIRSIRGLAVGHFRSTAAAIAATDLDHSA